MNSSNEQHENEHDDQCLRIQDVHLRYPDFGWDWIPKIIPLRWEGLVWILFKIKLPRPEVSIQASIMWVFSSH